MRPLSLMPILFLATLSNVACGGGPTSPDGATSYEGTWRGTTSQNLPITFTITNNTVTAISVDVRASMAGSSCTYTTGSQSRPTIAGGAFSIPIAGGTVSTTLRATFTSSTAVAGTIEAFSTSGLACGSVFVAGTPVSQAARTWQAAKG